MEKYKKISFGYVVKAVDDTAQKDYDLSKAVFSDNQTLSIRTKGRPYRTDNDELLINIRKPVFDDIFKNGLFVKGITYYFSQGSFEKLFSEKLMDIMPDDIYDAIFCGKQENGLDTTYINLFTKTCVATDANYLINSIFILDSQALKKKFSVLKGSGPSGNVRRSLPLKGDPNSRERLYNKDGGIKQERKYDKNGDPEQDNDYSDHGGHPDPHSHFWENGQRGTWSPFVPFED